MDQSSSQFEMSQQQNQTIAATNQHHYNFMDEAQEEERKQEPEEERPDENIGGIIQGNNQVETSAPNISSQDIRQWADSTITEEDRTMLILGQDTKHNIVHEDPAAGVFGDVGEKGEER